ncbi:ABC transporter substrate-binding protein [Mesorhizobium sp. ES1-4]|uniref:ABC transporter substrate-binding protein n=1 Tax=Mesorhizobium sp. ES1-4 TaxID=2876627 RepID=UPI001CCC7886|nr:ABC transporter substrate-binding protein [Mesorhizobium sp. ES1-4]MBZ9798451.1 ABC transporter substrate-binding protein [Mesorhizobium sp. ES1-4]
MSIGSIIGNVAHKLSASVLPDVRHRSRAPRQSKFMLHSRGQPYWLRLVAVSALTVLAAGTASAGQYGNCQVTGTKGAYHIDPVTPGQLTVEVSLPAPGWFNGDTPDTIADGYEFCMAAEIAARAGLAKVVLVNASWAQLIGGNTHNFDIALAEATITEPRKQVVDFSSPYFDSDIGILAKAGTKVDSAAVKQMRIGVKQGTAGAEFIMDTLKPSQEVKVYTTSPALVAGLQAGQVDAVAADTAYLLGFAAKSQGAFTVVGQYHTGAAYGGVFPKGSQNVAAVNAIIDDMKRDGTMSALGAKYLGAAWGVDPSKIEYFQP